MQYFLINYTAMVLVVTCIIGFKTYLTGRSQYTVLNDSMSTLQAVEYGVPQGSVLRPLLFLLYINDLGLISSLSARPKLFADDANIFVFSRDLNDLNNKCQSDVDKILEWTLANKLNINLGKTCYIIFNPTNKATTANLNICINKIPINRVNSTKYLGVLIDEKLNWKYHIDDLCLSLRKFIGIFYKLSFKLPPAVLKMLYFAMVYPRLLYGIEIYANTYSTYLHDLMILNNRLLRILQHRLPTTKSDELYKSYNTLPINKLFQFQLLIHTHNIFFNLQNLPKIFHAARITNSDVHSYNTRSSLDFHRKSINSRFGLKTSTNLCTKLWNSLPIYLKNLPSINLFKKGLKEFLYINEI